MAQKPLLLKDYLELDLNSDSSNSFNSSPRIKPDPTTVRFLLESERCRSGGRLIRSRSRIAFIKISAVINTLKNFPISSPTRPRPRPDDNILFSSSISKKLSRTFWKTKKNNKEKGDAVSDTNHLNSSERGSLYFPSPVVSSCSSCSEGSESFVSSTSCRSTLQKNQSPSQSHRQSSEEAESRVECRGCQSEEEKEQLSPVSVMDFPCQGEKDEDDGEDEDKDEIGFPCFEQSLANIERTTQQLLQKIRRFETLADLDLGPLDLHLRFASEDEEEDDADSHVSSSEEITAWDIIQRLRSNFPVGPQSEKLLADFFIEALSCSAGATSADVEGLLSAAGDWINGGGCLKAEEHGKDQLREMERNGRWRCFEDGRDDVAADVEVGVLGSLLHELVHELVEMD